MEYLVGFVIALFIALTGVGAGTITVPLLVLFLGVPAPAAVGIGLVFSAVVKLALLPVQIARRQVAWRVLGYMLLGGLPGVLIGSLLLKRLMTSGSNTLISALLGAILICTAGWRIRYWFRKRADDAAVTDRSFLLPWLMLPVGAEVGFSSAGAGALGSAALLGLTPLAPAQVVGTDIAFGFFLSLVGSSAHWASAGADTQVLTHLIAGGLLGAAAGMVLGSAIPRRPLRLVLWLWLLVLGGQFLIKSYREWDSSQPRAETYAARVVGNTRIGSH